MNINKLPENNKENRHRSIINTTNILRTLVKENMPHEQAQEVLDIISGIPENYDSESEKSNTDIKNTENK